MLAVIGKEHQKNAPQLGVLCSAPAHGAVHAHCIGMGNGCETCQLPALLGLCLDLVSCVRLRVFKSREVMFGAGNK